MPNIGTEVTYNGYTFPEYTTQATLDYKVEFTDDGIDYLWHHYHLELQFAYAADIDTESRTVDEWLKELRWTIQQPRKNLKIKLNEAEVIEVKAPDAKYGPFPQGLKVKQFAQKQACVVSWSVDFYVVECSENTPPILANRWDMSYDMDDRQLWRRTTNGIIYCSSKGDPDNFRNFGIPQLPMGFYRPQIRYRVTSDKLRLEYTIIDQQSPVAMPFPCSKWEGTYTEHTDFGLGSRSSLQFQHIALKAWGNVQASKANLLKFLAEILSSRVTLNAGGGGGGNYLQEASVSEGLHETWVGIQATAIKIPGQKRGNIPLSTAIGANIYAVQDLPSADPGDRGTYLAKMFVAEASNNCGGAEPVISGSIGDQATPGIDYTGSQNSPGDTGAFGQTGATDFSPEQLDSPYTLYQIESKYEKDEHKFHLPVAGQGSNSVVVQVAQPTMRRKIRWTAIRQGKKPLIPKLSHNSDEEVLQSWKGGKPPAIGADGDTLVWEVCGEFDIAVKRPPQDNDPLSLGSYPLDTLELNTPDTQITSDQYSFDIV